MCPGVETTGGLGDTALNGKHFVFFPRYFQTLRHIFCASSTGDGHGQTQNKNPKTVTEPKLTDATPDTASVGPRNDVQNEATHSPQDASPPITDERSKENDIRSATEAPSSNVHNSANTKERANISTSVSSGDSPSRTVFPEGESGDGLIKNGVAEHQEVVNGGFKSQDVDMENAVVNESGEVYHFIDFFYLWLMSHTGGLKKSLVGDEKGTEGVNDRMEITGMYIYIYHT
jgi:hypothetical protein